MNLDALRSLNYGLYIISTKDGDTQNGCIANTLQQITSSPVKLSITLNKENYTTKLIQKSGYFCATPLCEEVSMDVIATFGFKSGVDFDKFSEIPFNTDINGINYVKDNVCSSISLKVVDSIDVGTHIMFIGEAQDMAVLSNEKSMTYAYYHEVKKGSTPKNASSYTAPKEEVGYVCTICGYVHKEETLPEDFICPICKQGADKFKKL